MDARVIAATHRNLEVAVQENQFRQDLYFRLNVALIHLPALRERPEDIPDLALYFLQKHGAELGSTSPIITPEAIGELQHQPWPGNVRHWTALPDGRADYFNLRWFEYTGLSLEQSQNMGWLSMVHPDDLQNCINGWDEAVQTGEPFQAEFRLKRATQGSCRWHLGRALPVRSLDGRLIRWVGTCTDIHDQKLAEEKLRQRLEEELMRTTAELFRSNADLERFAYLASHDLQEPLRAVASFTQLLAMEYADKLGTDAREYIGHVVEGAKRMQVLINQLLHYSRLGTGHKPFALVDCRKIYETAVANLKVAIEESGAVPTSAPLPQVLGDSVQLIQVFQNLLANAIKFRRGHGPQIHVWAEHKHKEWQFAVRDNGIGIDSRNFNRLFVIFQRLHHREEYSGTGIGLAVCKKIVDLHGGRIWVESKLGEGSTFYFTIPKVE